MSFFSTSSTPSSRLSSHSPVGGAIASRPSAAQSIPPLEILEVIFEDLAILLPTRTSGSSAASMQEIRTTRTWLLAVALACKSFCPTALDLLWRNMDNLIPLLKLLPSFKAVNGAHIISGAITSADWARLDCYARRVRRVTYRTVSPSIEIHPSVDTAISLIHPQPILPNLESVTFPPSGLASSSSPFPDAILLAVPTIRHVELSSRALSTSFLTMFLATLAGTSPNLSSLKLSGQPLAVLKNTHTLSSFVQLEMLELKNVPDEISPDLIRSISTLKQLHSLSIHLSSPGLFPAMLFVPWTTMPDDRFRALKSLHIQCDWPIMITAFLACIPFGVLLHTLTINARPNPTSQQVVLPNIDGIFQDIPHRWTSSLQHLELSNFGTFARSHYYQLLKLHNLQTFRLQDMFMPISATDIPVITAAWPHIRSLSLPVASGFPIHSLHHFAESCKNLTDLEVTIATLDLPTFNTTPVCTHPLRVLNVADSSCPSARVHALPRHLDRLFPRLRSLRARGPDKSRWEEVEGLIFAFQDVRLHAAAQS